MKYPVDTIVMINNREWRVGEFRMGRGREWEDNDMDVLGGLKSVFTRSPDVKPGAGAGAAMRPIPKNQV